MTLKAQMAADLGTVFLNTDEFAETGTYQPLDAPGTFSLTVVPGDDSPSAKQGDGGQSQTGRITAVASWASFEAGMLAVDRADQGPSRGDQFVIPSPSPLVGTWALDTWATDTGGGLTMVFIRSDWFTIGAAGARGGV